MVTAVSTLTVEAGTAFWWNRDRIPHVTECICRADPKYPVQMHMQARVFDFGNFRNFICISCLVPLWSRKLQINTYVVFKTTDFVLLMQSETVETPVWPKCSSTPYVTPDVEQEKVMQEGGSGITQSMVLGRNFAGIDQVLPPLTEDEGLFVTRYTKCRTFITQALMAIKTIMMQLSKSQQIEESLDVADCVPSHDLDGSRRPPCSIDGSCAIFVDTIIAGCNTQSMAPVLDFFRLLNLRRDGNPSPHQKIGVTPLRKSKSEGQTEKLFRWKVTAADVPIGKMQVVYEVYRQGRLCHKEGNQHNESKLINRLSNAYEAKWKHLAPDVELYNIIASFKIVRDGKLILYEFDLTDDVPGTLDPFDFKDRIESAGFKVVNDSKCGKNCVKYRSEEDGSYHPKAYNKIMETMQQGKVRDGGISDKFSKLVFPSTQKLKQKIYHPSFSQNGISRLEITFMLEEEMPKWRDMTDRMDEHRSILKQSLVACSIHDHIDQMGKYAQASVILYFPHVFAKKREMLLLGQGDSHGDVYRKNLSESLKLYPDALLARWINSLTGKMNGEVINGVHDTRSPDQSAWDQVLLHAAACSIGDPFLFVCVRGHEQWFNQPGPKQMYFRVVRLRRKAMAPKMHLDTCFLTQDNVPSECNLEAMGVDVDSLSMKPVVVKSQQMKAAEFQTDITIDGNDLVQPVDDLQSDGTEAISKYAGCRSVKEEHLSSEFKPIKELIIRRVGKKSTPRCCFNYQGAWFFSPPQKHAALSEYADDRSKTILIRWGPNGFEFKVETREDQNANVKFEWCGRPANSESIPIRQDAQAIKGIGFKKVKGQSLSSYVQLDGENRYWLPSSITELILTRLRVDSGIEVGSNEAPLGWQYDYLNDCSILRTEEAKVRVCGKGNAEISVSILDADGNTYISQRLTHSSRKRRWEDSQ